MNEIQSKYIEIILDKQKPQSIDNSIIVSARAENINEELEYKFLMGKKGIWSVIKEFSKENQCSWVPNGDGDYIVMVQAREEFKDRPLDYLAKEEFSIIGGEIKLSMDKNFNGIGSNDRKLNKNKSLDKSENYFKDVIGKANDNILFLKASQVNAEEKEALMKGIDKTMDEVAVTKDVVKEETTKRPIEECDVKNSEDEKLTNESSKNEFDNENIQNEIIDEILVEKNNIYIGEKAVINVNSIEPGTYLYRFYIKSLIIYFLIVLYLNSIAYLFIFLMYYKSYSIY